MKIVDVIKDIILAILVFGGSYLFCVYGLMVYGMSEKDSIEMGTVGFVFLVIIMIIQNKPTKKRRE